jgi:predicted alpha/beta superfamily hydrolase
MSTQFPPITIPVSHTRSLKSSNVGDEFQIFISLPENYAKTAKAYPVLYIVDANFAIGSATEIARMLSQGEFELPELIVVGIGYHLKNLAEGSTALRWRDLTPTELSAELYDSMQYQTPDTPPYAGSGKAGALLQFIREELMPFINAGYRTRADDCTLWGDSLGGLFALYVLFH